MKNQSLPTCVLRFETLARYRSVTVLVDIDEIAQFCESSKLLSGFTRQELDLVHSRAKGIHSLAARYAAKQGAQALSTLSWTEFEVIRPTDCPPVLCLKNQGSDSLSKYFTLSLSHDEPYAVAYLIELEKYQA